MLTLQSFLARIQIPQKENVLWIRPSWAETHSATCWLCDLGSLFSLVSVSSFVKWEV